MSVSSRADSMRCLLYLLPVFDSFFPAARLQAYDFRELFALAESAVLGENIDEAVSGFEIKILQDGEPIFHQAFGDWEIDRLAKADSSTKTVSATLMMSLTESGENGFSLDSRLSNFLPEYDKEGFRDITVRQAFSHTSGMKAEGATSLILLNPNNTLREAAFLLSQQPLENGPAGTAFGYGGLSMHAAGAAAEVAAGERFVDLLSERILTPLQMAESQLVRASEENPRVAGGMDSTASEFSRFMDMLLNDGIDRVSGTRILSEQSVKEMLTRQTTDEQQIAFSPVDNHRYGLGVWLDQLGEQGPTVDALAVGGRGFHSWINRSEGLVFTFATDHTRFANIEELSSIMHRAVLAAVVPEPASALVLAMGLSALKLAPRREHRPRKIDGTLAR